MKRDTFILKCFLQFTCTNLDGSQKDGGNILNLLQKEGGPSEKKKGGGGSTPDLKTVGCNRGIETVDEIPSKSTKTYV